MLVSAGLFGLVFGFSHASTAGWWNTTTLSFVAPGALVLGCFIYRQTRVPNPALPLRVVFERNHGVAYRAIFMIALGQFSMLLFVTYYLQQALGFSVIQTGLAFLP